MKKLVVGITSPFSVFLIKGQLKYFSDLGYKVYLIAPDHPDVEKLCSEENSQHISVNFRRDISLLHDLLSLFKVIYYFIKVSPDIVNVGTPKAGLLGMIGSRVLGIRKRVYTCRGFRFEHETGMKRKVLLLMEKITGYFATDIICISPSIRALALQERIFASKKCVVIGHGSSNGIDLSRFNRDRIDWNKTEDDKQTLGIKGRFVFGYVGRIIDRKGIGDLVVAFKRLKSVHNDVALLIVGHAEIDQVSDVSIIEEIKRNPDIIGVGWQDDVPRYLSLMQVFVLPAWWEGFGNVLIQAAAMGIPVVSTRATGTQDAVKDGYNGSLVAPRDIDSLTMVMEEYYLNPVIRQRHGENGFEWAKQFQSDVVWKGIEGIYNGR